jgi:hypothetical protein
MSGISGRSLLYFKLTTLALTHRFTRLKITSLGWIRT